MVSCKKFLVKSYLSVYLLTYLKTQEVFCKPQHLLPCD